MTDYTEQTERIKNKLTDARKADKEFKVFGAGNHKYEINAPIGANIAFDFEQEYGINLPECYKVFVTQVGNGGIGYGDSAAGPFYGIFPFGTRLDELVYENIAQSFQQDCKIYPYMTDSYWEDLTRKINETDDILDEEYDTERGKIFAGILPIGSQGCTYIHGIILNGEHKGKVVNLDMDCQKPKFTFENNFLDWYERWLDEIIAGKWQDDKDSWFAYTIAGLEEDILEQYANSNNYNYKIDCLSGLLDKGELLSSTIDFVENEYKTQNNELKTKALQILSKLDYSRSKPYLKEELNAVKLSAFQFIYWYAKDKLNEWTEILEDIAPQINDPETFRFFSYILNEKGSDYDNIIIPFTKHADSQIRITAFYTLGKLPAKHIYTDIFIKGLCDTNNQVIHITLQALSDIKDYRLLKYYKQIAEKFPTEQDYILSNLNHRLKDYNLTNESILAVDLNKYEEDRSKKWFQFWK